MNKNLFLLRLIGCKIMFAPEPEGSEGGAETPTTSLDIMNDIRTNIGGAYEERIPEATRENIASVGNTILKLKDNLNAFFTELLNRIGKTVIDRMESMEDIYAIFGEDRLEFGNVIQKIFIDVPKAHAFDGTATTAMLSQEKGAIHVEYTQVDRKLFYKTTISIPTLKEAFTSVEKLDQFIEGLIAGMATALSYDKYVMLTETFKEHAGLIRNVKALNDTDNHYVRVLNVPATVAQYNKTTGLIEWASTGAKEFLKLVRIASRSLKFPHPLSYGDVVVDETEGASLENDGTISVVRTPVNSQVVALEVSTMANIDVDALAVLFNLDKAEMETRKIEIEDGALGLHVDVSEDEVEGYVGGFICDKKAVERGTSFEDTDSFKNPEGEYVNFWNHYWGYMGISKFRDFVPIVFPIKSAQAGE